MPYDDLKLRQIIESSRAQHAPQVPFPTEETKKADTVVPRKEAPSTSSIKKDIHAEISNLPSEQEEQQSQFSKNLRKFMDNAQETIFHATRALNDVTGYLSIEKLKDSIENLENELKQLKQAMRDAKTRYSEAIQRRSDLQKEINELLTRKHNWSGQDVERFTELYRNDHTNQQEENSAEQRLAEVELGVEAIQTRLTHSILTRYHEEQIWSDKIRRASTWGTWVIMGVNVMLFAVATFFVEPWKRKRLVRAFEEQVLLKMESFTTEMRSLVGGGPIPEKSPEENTHVVSFAHLNSWIAFKLWAKRLYYAVQNPATSFSISRVDMGIVTAILVTLGTIVGRLIASVI